MRRLRAITRAFELGFSDSKQERPIRKGKELFLLLHFAGIRVADIRYLKNAYSAGRWEYIHPTD